ncbi:MAG: hypothetical protein IVW36_08685 [Dehalococcoidia bacterium]|nr:hypothetical protein [Dehalococcoidia bacterium]
MIAEQLAAASRAEQATLWADAAGAYERALALHADAAGAVDELALLTALGRCYWFDGQARPAWRTLRRAIALARERDDAPAMARATVELLRIWGPLDRQRAMADEALAALGDEEPHLRALLLLRTHRNAAAIEIGERFGFEDVLEVGVNEAAWGAIGAGRAEEFIALLRRTHATYDRIGEYDVAAGQLRGAAFALMQLGRLRDGIALAEDARRYAASRHLRFTEQLALMDLAGAAFAHCEFARCQELLDGAPGEADFRADLYRMWMAQHRDLVPAAMRLLVDPDRAGATQTAISQIAAAAAGILFAAGKHDAASEQLRIWADAARAGESFAEEAPVPLDCLLALADEPLIIEVRDAIAAWDARRALVDRYAPLQGRSLDMVRGALALRLGDPAAAMAHFTAGGDWARGECCPVDEGRCLAGLGDALVAAGRPDEARARYAQAAAAFDAAGAAYELRRLRERTA